MKYQIIITQYDGIAGKGWFGRVVDADTKLSILHYGNEIDAFDKKSKKVLELLLIQLHTLNQDKENI